MILIKNDARFENIKYSEEIQAFDTHLLSTTENLHLQIDKNI